MNTLHKPKLCKKGILQMPWEKSPPPTPLITNTVHKCTPTLTANHKCTDTSHQDDIVSIYGAQDFFEEQALDDCADTGLLADGELPTSANLTPPYLSMCQKLRAEQILPLADWIQQYRPYRLKVANALRACATRLEFATNANGTLYLAFGRFCNQWRLCPICNGRRAFKLASKYTRAIEHLLHTYPEAILYHVTLTMKPSLNPGYAARDLRRRVSAYLRRGQKFRREHHGSFVESARCIGAFHSAHVQWNDATQFPLPPYFFNVHDHALWACDSEVCAKQLSNEYASGSGWHVHAEKLHAYKDQNHTRTDLLNHAERWMRYSLQSKRMPPEVRFVAEEKLTALGRAPRLVTTHGKLRNFLPEQSFNYPSLPTYPLIFDWKNGAYHLVP